MTAPNPNAINSAPKKADAGSIGLIVLVILAVIASMVMLISGSASALKLALIAALWAAVLGFFLVVRYRREAAESAALLEAERSRQPAPVQQDSDIMEEIRRELSSIRAQIEELSGREFTYEPAALHAEARRIMELEEKTREPEVNFTQASKGAPTADAVAGRLGSQPSAPRTPQHNPLDDIIAQRVQQRNEQKAPAQQPVPPQTAPKQHFPAGQSAQVSPSPHSTLLPSKPSAGTASSPRTLSRKRPRRSAVGSKRRRKASSLSQRAISTAPQSRPSPVDAAAATSGARALSPWRSSWRR